MSIYPEFIQPIKNMFRSLVHERDDNIFAAHIQEVVPERIQRVNFVLNHYPHHPSKALPAYHFTDIPDEEFVENEDISTFLIRDSEGRSGDLQEDQLPLRMDIESLWEVEGIHPWTEEGGQASDLSLVVYVLVNPDGEIIAKLVDLHE